MFFTLVLPSNNYIYSSLHIYLVDLEVSKIKILSYMYII